MFTIDEAFRAFDEAEMLGNPSTVHIVGCSILQSSADIIFVMTKAL